MLNVISLGAGVQSSVMAKARIISARLKGQSVAKAIREVALRTIKHLARRLIS